MSGLEIDQESQGSDLRTFRLRGSLIGDGAGTLWAAILDAASHGVRAIVIDGQGVRELDNVNVLAVRLIHAPVSIAVIPNNPDRRIRLRLEELARIFGRPRPGTAGVPARRPEPHPPRAGAAEEGIPGDAC